MIDWMQNAGHQWVTTDHRPEAGSDLAFDDASRPRVSPYASFGVVTAIDHFGSVVDAMVSGQPFRHYAHFTTLRTALLASERVQWMLAPDESVERRLRCAQVRFQNLQEERKAFNGFAGSHLEPDTEQSRLKAIADLDAQIASLEGEATALGAQNLTAPLDTVSMLRDHLVDADTWYGSAILSLWRTGSAAAHGYHWTETHRTNPGELDELSFDLALGGAFLMITGATALYHKRASAPGA
jgi:hypothetical protein